jgi:hypothetical protein
MTLIRDVDEPLFTDAQTTAVIEGEGSVYLTHTITTLGNMGSSVTRQMHYISFMLKYKGLTRSGNEIISRMGYVASHGSFDTWIKGRQAESERLAR